MNLYLEEVLQKIENSIYSKPGYNIDQLCWDIQDINDFSEKCAEKIDMPTVVIPILCDIKFEWEKKMQAARFSSYYLQNADKFENIKAIFHDDDSKNLLEWLIKRNLAYMICGDIAKRILDMPKGVIQIKERDFINNFQNIYQIENMKIYTCETEIYDTWIREQYLLKGICEPEKGDIVISVGAFYGETSIWFSKMVGTTGMVYAFEAVAKNAWVADCNCKRNKIQNVIVENICLWSSCRKIFIQPQGAASCVSYENSGILSEAITLDVYCCKNGIEKVDFIKMDIEGAEYEVLCGAEQTIKRNKPKLAICVYHSAEDFIIVPQKIKEFVPEYKLFLSHKREDLMETVVFAVI